MSATGTTLVSSRSLREEVLTSDLSSDPRVITEVLPPYRIVHVNQPWCQATGYTQEMLLGNSCKLIQGSETCRHTLHVSSSHRDARAVALGAGIPCRQTSPRGSCPSFPHV